MKVCEAEEPLTTAFLNKLDSLHDSLNTQHI